MKLTRNGKLTNFKHSPQKVSWKFMTVIYFYFLFDVNMGNYSHVCGPCLGLMSATSLWEIDSGTWATAAGGSDHSECMMARAQILECCELSSDVHTHARTQTLNLQKHAHTETLNVHTCTHSSTKCTKSCTHSNTKCTYTCIKTDKLWAWERAQPGKCLPTRMKTQVWPPEPM